MAEGEGQAHLRFVRGDRNPIGRDAPRGLVDQPALAHAGLTDQQGSYTLTNVPLGRHQVRVRMLGYTSAHVWADLRADEMSKTADFVLDRSVIPLDEVVVTGTGAATERKQLGNTIATLDSRTIENAPVQTFSEAIAAREPGVQILPSSGLTGEGARIRIRGNASLSQSN